MSEDATFQRLRREPFDAVLKQGNWVSINAQTFLPEIPYRPAIIERLATYGWTHEDFVAEHKKLLTKLGWYQD